MATPIVIVTKNGLPVTLAGNGRGTPMTVATYGLPVQVVASGGMPVTGFTVGPDITAPIITSSNTISQPENTALVHFLSANEPVTWAKVGGADSAKFTLGSGATAGQLSLPAKDYEAPDDADANRTYIVQVQATDAAANASAIQTITVTITDVADGPSEDAATTAWSAAVVTAGGTVSTAQRSRVDALITAYKAAGIWTSMDRVWLLAAENAQQTKIDLVARASWIAVGAPGFIANTGYNSPNSGGTDAINTNFTPSTNGVAYTQNSNHFSVYARSGSSANGCYVGVNDGGQFSYLEQGGTAADVSFEANGSTFLSASGLANNLGQFFITRTSASTVNAYRNGNTTPFQTNSGDSSGPIASIPFYLFRINTFGHGSNASVVLAAATFGGGLTAAQMAAADTAMNTYMTAIGNNVYASATGFNGGRSQVNLNAVGLSEFPFANVCLQGAGWQYNGGADANSLVLIGELDANGMPTTLSAGTVYAVTQIPASLARPGNYVIRTTGTGTVSADGATSPLATGSFTGVLASGVLTVSGLTGTINKGQALVGTGITAGSCIGAQLTGTTYQINNYLTGAASTQSLASVAMTTSNGSLTVSGTGRYVYYPGNSGTAVPHSGYITALGAPPVSQFAIVHVDDEMAWVLDPYAFNPQFKSVLSTAKFGAIRDLNWALANISNVTTWATRKPQTYFSYGAEEFRPSLDAGTATHSTGTTRTISSLTHTAAVFTASISGTTMTVTAVTSGTIVVGAAVNVASGTTITALGTGAGGTGTYTLSVSQTVGSTTLSSGRANVTTSTAHGQTGTFKVSIQTRSLGYPSYNGQFTATVVNTTTFTYPLSGAPVTPSSLGTANFGVYDYAVTFGSGAPVDKQTMHIAFDLMGNADYNPAVTFSGTKTCNWSGHSFTGGERVGFSKEPGNSNLPANVGPGTNYYVLAANLVAGVSFEFSKTPGGAAVTFSPPGGTQSGARLFTINLNGTGAVPLRSPFGNPLYPDGGLGTVPSPYWQYGQRCIGTIVYDVDFGAWLMVGGCLNNTKGLINGVPPEIFLKLCRELSAHSHHAIPVLALDPQTDYVPNLYTIAKGISYNVPRFEACNEVWNSNQPVTSYARAKAHIFWNAQFSTGSFDEVSWMGKVNSTTGQILAAMAGSVGNNYRMMLGVKSDEFGSVGGGASALRFTSDNFIAQSQGTQTLSVPAFGLNVTFTKTAAYLYGTHASPANYLAPAGYTTFNPATFIANFAFCTASISAGVMTVTGMGMSFNGVGTLKVGQTVTDFYGKIPGGVTISSLGTGTGGTGTYNLSNAGFSLISTLIMATNSTATAQVNTFLNGMNGAAAVYNNAEVLKYFTNCKNFMTSLPNNAAGVKLGVSPYEGGYGPDYGGNASLNTLYAAAKYNQYMGIALCSGGTLADASTINGNYDDLIAIGCDFPSAFTLGGGNNAWSICDPDIYITLPNTSYTAITAFNA